MATKKKRNKQYKGSVQARPTIVKVSAVNRNPVSQYWVDHKKFAKPVGITTAVVAVIIIVIIGIIDIIW